MSKKEVLVFYGVGLVERGARYEWKTGYSRRQDGREQPWKTRRECQAEARQEGKVAHFVPKTH